MVKFNVVNAKSPQNKLFQLYPVILQVLNVVNPILSTAQISAKANTIPLPAPT